MSSGSKGEGEKCSKTDECKYPLDCDRGICGGPSDNTLLYVIIFGCIIFVCCILIGVGSGSSKSIGAKYAAKNALDKLNKTKNINSSNNYDEIYLIED